MNAFIKLWLSGEAFPIDIGGTKTLRMMRFPIKSVFEPQNLPKTLCNWHLFSQFVASPFPFPQSQETVLFVAFRNWQLCSWLPWDWASQARWGAASTSTLLWTCMRIPGDCDCPRHGGSLWGNNCDWTNDGFPEFSHPCCLRYTKLIQNYQGRKLLRRMPNLFFINFDWM